MAKKKNELNGVLVYRRWCLGAVFSALVLLLVMAAPVMIFVYRWFAIYGYTEEPIVLTGMNTLAVIPALAGVIPLPIINDAFNSFVAEVTSAVSGAFPLYHILNMAIQWALFVVLVLIVILTVVEFFFFFFYLVTGRVVSPAAPVKVSWALFIFMAIFAGGTFGYCIVLNMDPDLTLAFDYLWPIYFAAGSLVAAILMSVVYVAAFKDKFFIGRAKKFGSGESNQYLTNQYFGQPANQPQVIIVNGGNPTTPYVVPQQSPQNDNSPVRVINAQQPAEEAAVAPRGVLPSNITSIGGHSFSRNLDLKYADIPAGIKELGVGAFANCLNLEVVSIPKSVKRIRKNCFFNCSKLARINYAGTKSEWRYVVRGANWLDRAGSRTVVCSDGAIIVDPHR